MIVTNTKGKGGGKSPYNYRIKHIILWEGKRTFAITFRIIMMNPLIELTELYMYVYWYTLYLQFSIKYYMIVSLHITHKQAGSFLLNVYKLIAYYIQYINIYIHICIYTFIILLQSLSSYINKMKNVKFFAFERDWHQTLQARKEQHPLSPYVGYGDTTTYRGMRIH